MEQLENILLEAILNSGWNSLQGILICPKSQNVIKPIQQNVWMYWSLPSYKPHRKANDFYWLGEFLYQDFTEPQVGPIVLFESVGGNEV